MELFNKSNKKKNSINDDVRKTSLIQWGVAVAVLIFVIMVMVTNFCVISRNDAYKTIKSELILESDIYASNIAHQLELSYSAANSVAAIMADEKKSSNADIAWYADLRIHRIVYTWLSLRITKELVIQTIVRG